MTQLNALPGQSRLAQEQRRTELITRTSRLAFEIEAARSRGDQGDALRLSVDYHQGMADLLEITPSWCEEGAAVNASTRQQHLGKAEADRRELEALTSNDQEET